MLELKLVNRGFAKTMLLLPGWATDWRIFSNLKLNYNYLLARIFSLRDFSRDLSGQLDEMKLEKISLFGWSLGAFLAAEFAARQPGRVEGLFLVGARRRYPPDELALVREKLRENRKAFLYKFYLDCFSPDDAEGLGWFRQALLRDYLKKIPAEDLETGLDYLAGAEIKPEGLARVGKIKIVHGAQDKIAPLAEAQELRKRLSKAELNLFPALGHIVFLNRQFQDKLNG